MFGMLLAIVKAEARSPTPSANAVAQTRMNPVRREASVAAEMSAVDLPTEGACSISTVLSMSLLIGTPCPRALP